MDAASVLTLNNSARVSLVPINPNVEFEVSSMTLRGGNGNSFNLNNIERGKWLIDVSPGTYTLRLDAKFSPGNGTAQYGSMINIFGKNNILPIADAGEDKVVLTNVSATLDGTKSYDPDGSISSYQWLQAQGEPFITLVDTDTPIHLLLRRQILKMIAGFCSVL
jgi:hypothetical protein